MGSRPVIVVLGAVLAALLWIFLKETYLAVAVETAVERSATYLGMSKPEMLAAATPYVLAIAAAAAVAWASYGLGVRDRISTPDFDIEFAPGDARFVEISENRIIYRIGLRNLAHRSILFPSIRARNTEFTNQILTERTDWGRPIGAMNVFIANVLDPNALELMELFGLPTEDKYIRPDHKDLLANRHRFTLEARGPGCENLLG